ncbi:MAG: dTDP-4-dehydrorhamnose reductase [Betaproteobacteria bacterium]|nr:dTDP-4-dehydrorhamnose reductase [Betaproteobacteria bacterium]
MAGLRILLTGAQGQVGHELARLLRAHGDVRATDRATLDLADPDAIVAAMRAARPQLVVNAGAYTAVDLAERERDLAFAVNARAPQVLAEEAKRAGALLIHYSTDYVFDGEATAPYAEGAPTGPLNAYGASKLEGEQAIAATGAHALVLRTSWVYGTRGKNFLLTILRLAAERDELTIVADQTGTPNWSRTLAQATSALVARGLPDLVERAGLYHLSSTGATTWHGFATAIVGGGGRPRVVPIATADYPTPARRPAYGVLATDRFRAAFGFALPPWDEALAACLAAHAAERTD